MVEKSSFAFLKIEITGPGIKLLSEEIIGKNA